MKWILAAALGTLGLVAWLSPTTGEEPPTAAEQQPSFWMKKKLHYSEQILSGLANEDFEQIGQNAKAMNALGHIEKWVRAGRPDYRAQLTIFHDANNQLIARAEEQDLDGAALAYLQLTLSCVNCHKVVRNKSSHENP